MAALANFVGRGAERSAPLLSALTARIGAALRRSATERYAEQRGRVERTGIAGLI